MSTDFVGVVTDEDFHVRLIDVVVKHSLEEAQAYQVEFDAQLASDMRALCYVLRWYCIPNGVEFVDKYNGRTINKHGQPFNYFMDGDFMNDIIGLEFIELSNQT